MWIGKEEFLVGVKRTALLEGEIKGNLEKIGRLEKEIDYWREMFESAQHRADRISDKALTVSGIGPVSDLGVREADDHGKKYAKMMKEAENQANEMFGEELNSPLTEGEEGGGGLLIDPQLLGAIVGGLRD